MTIKVGDKLPQATLRLITPDGPKPVTTQEFFSGKKIVLFGLPGAFTPTCHKNHLPGFLTEEAAFKAKGVVEIAMTSVNDPFVLTEWSKATGSAGHIAFLVGRQRRFRQGARPRVRRLDGRPRRTLQALFDAGRGRRGEAPQHRGIAWEGGLVERVASARADVKAGARRALARRCWSTPRAASYSPTKKPNG